MAQRGMASPDARAAAAPPPTPEERIAQIEAQMEALDAELMELVEPEEPDEPEPAPPATDEGDGEGDENQQ